MSAVLVVAFLASAAAPRPPTPRAVPPAPPAVLPAAPVVVAPRVGEAVIVLPLTGDAAAVDVADEVRAAVIGLTLGTAQPASTTKQHLDTATALGMGCATTAADCAVMMGGLAGGDVVVNGSVTSEGGKLKVALQAFDVVTVKERGRADAVVDVDAAARVREVRRLVVRLLAPARELGSVALTSTPEGAAVMVDGVLRGVTPLAAPLEVKPGSHEVYVALAGFESQTHVFDVAFEGTASLALQLKPGAAGPPRARAAPLEALNASQKPAAAKEFLRVAVYHVDGAGIEARQAQVVTEALLLELRKLSGVSVIGLEEVKAMLDFEANRQALGCTGDSECLSEIADALGADAVVTGTATVVGDGSVFGLKRLDPKSAQARQVTKRLERAGGEELLAAIGPAVEELFPEHPLKAGQVRGVAPEMALRINPPPLPQWAFWTTTATAGALAAATAGAGGVNLYSRARYSDQGAVDVANGKDLKDTQDVIVASAYGFWVGVGVTTIVGAAAGVESLFVDWRGYAESAE
ncbi:MAG: PEGA domain-containing protein [Deltaproteobacteria bacterium]|nr:PEGA domain-containing protein [Deltaproteobacteria bacterium]